MTRDWRQYYKIQTKTRSKVKYKIDPVIKYITEL